LGKKTRLQMRSDLATDLKITIDTELSVAELNRSIERAFSDLSRFLPDEKIYEDSLQFSVTDESVTFPKDTDTDGVVAAEDISAFTAGSTCTIDGQPDVPRPLTVTITDANDSITGLTLIVDGIDKDDQALQEIFYFSTGDSKTIVGKKYFKAVYSVEADQVAGVGASDVLDIGWGAYTDVWVYLANSPIKWQSESATDNASATITRNTDFYIDYANGRVKAISGGDISAEEVCTFTYKKSQIGIDLSNLPDLIRVQRVEYPVGGIPQNFVQGDTFGNYYVVTGSGESEGQEQMAEDKQYRIYYDATHQTPGEYSPSTIPDFLEGTVETMAGAYALYILALKQEHQAVTDIASARSALESANGAHTALTSALTNIIKYLNNNDNADAAGILAKITTDDADLKAAVVTALDAMNSYLDDVGKASTGDIALSVLAKEDYMGSTNNYVNGGTEPDILQYLTTGDGLLNQVTKGGEGQDVPRAYRDYAAATKEALVAAFETDRQLLLQGATARTNAAMGYANEAAQRLSTLRTYLEESAGYIAISTLFGTEAEQRISDINAYLAEANHYAGAASADMSASDRFRVEADERRAEVYSIWRDRKQYLGDFTTSSMRQMPEYK